MVKYLHEWTKRTVIKLSGDYTGATGEVFNTVGQGTTLAAMGVSLLIGYGLQHAVAEEYREECAKVGQIVSLPQGFVDDMMACANNANGLRRMADGFRCRSGTAQWMLTKRSHQ